MKTAIRRVSNDSENYSNIIDVVAKRTKGPAAGLFKQYQRQISAYVIIKITARAFVAFSLCVFLIFFFFFISVLYTENKIVSFVETTCDLKNINYEKYFKLIYYIFRVLVYTSVYTRLISLTSFKKNGVSFAPNPARVLNVFKLLCDP